MRYWDGPVTSWPDTVTRASCLSPSASGVYYGSKSLCFSCWQERSRGHEASGDTSFPSVSSDFGLAGTSNREHCSAGFIAGLWGIP